MAGLCSGWPGPNKDFGGSCPLRSSDGESSSTQYARGPGVKCDRGADPTRDRATAAVRVERIQAGPLITRDDLPEAVWWVQVLLHQTLNTSSSVVSHVAGAGVRVINSDGKTAESFRRGNGPSLHIVLKSSINPSIRSFIYPLRPAPRLPPDPGGPWRDGRLGGERARERKGLPVYSFTAGPVCSTWEDDFKHMEHEGRRKKTMEDLSESRSPRQPGRTEPSENKLYVMVWAEAVWPGRIRATTMSKLQLQPGSSLTRPDDTDLARRSHLPPT
ncbi:hypothetical protein DPEC_G00328170 [Dallia pectoralis]|uniref:Uncharacterized protein n=1 Tax=Dallia pectoralis TaxID=75939 RepID=A0ACC2F8F2_DALPE|nr:hypothetical protein DPEC_G00328170 [Dallia pectoralis]